MRQTHDLHLCMSAVLNWLALYRSWKIARASRPHSHHPPCKRRKAPELGEAPELSQTQGGIAMFAPAIARRSQNEGISEHCLSVGECLLTTRVRSTVEIYHLFCDYVLFINTDFNRSGIFNTLDGACGQLAYQI